MRLRMSFTPRPAYLLGLCVLAVAAGAAACSGGPAQPTGHASLRLLLTDDPIDEVEEVNIYFTGVAVKPAGGGLQTLSLELQTNPVDLLTLTEDVVRFAAGAVPSGEYEFIHINIDASQSYLVENGARKPLRVPSQEIKIVGGFTLDEATLTTLTLDFDARASLLRLGNGDWLLRPTVIITGNDTDAES